MKRMDKELIEHIKDQLNAHEEVYTPGAWERFSVQEDKKQSNFMWWPIWSAAAILLIIGGLLFLRTDADHTDKLSTNKTKPGLTEVPSKTENNNLNTNTNQDKQASATPLKNNKPVLPQVNNPVNNQKSDYLAAQNSKNSFDEAIYPLKNETNTSLATVVSNNLSEKYYSNNIVSVPKPININIALKAKEKVKTKITFEDILEQDSYSNKFAKTEKSKGNEKWEPGVFIAPAMGNDSKVNMNYGFSLSYSLADKLSISSGIAYTALSSTSNPNAKNDYANSAPNAPSNSSIAPSSSSRSLQSIDASLRGINIPLELKYNISNKLYTGVGISALAILNNKQENNYLVTQAQNKTVVNSFGMADQRMLLVTEKVSEPQPEAAIAPEKYLGFYNFSLGYKQKVSKKTNFAVEPFLRVPMKSFSKDNLNLTNGGLRLKFDF